MNMTKNKFTNQRLSEKLRAIRIEHQFDIEFSRIYAQYARFLNWILEEGRRQGITGPGLDTHTTV
jgi:hypothetical protein